MDSPATPNSSQLRLPTLLLVEDHDSYRQLARQTLQHFLPGWQVLEADCVTAAAEELRTEAIDVMVCDMTLPDGSATDLLNRFPSLSCERTKVIVFSNLSATQLDLVTARPEVQGCLTKERGLKELARMIERIATENVCRSPGCSTISLPA